mmetsp:Transcript_69480/g.212991  ORF Transcript_69480/g.212991 Transcript_69480/m.212991 type:complete len:261 (-) Transcript_69480:597-1379(-)
MASTSCMRSRMAASTMATELGCPRASSMNLDSTWWLSRKTRSTCATVSLSPASSACASWSLPRISDMAFDGLSCQIACTTLSKPWAMADAPACESSRMLFSRPSTLSATYAFKILSSASDLAEISTFTLFSTASLLAAMSAFMLFSTASLLAEMSAFKLLSRTSARATISAFRLLSRTSALAAPSTLKLFSTRSDRAAPSAFKLLSSASACAAMSAFSLFSAPSTAPAVSACTARTAASTGPRSVLAASAMALECCSVSR